MNLALAIQGLGSVGLFASRAFLPAFATAMALRFGPEFGWIARSGLFPHVRAAPTWFTQDGTLIGLGLLSALELAAERVPEAREIYGNLVHALRSIMATLTYLGVVGTSDRAMIDPILRQADVLGSLPALMVGASTFVASRFRDEAVDTLFPPDDDDAFGLRRLYRRMGDASSLLGPFGLLVFPFLTLAGLALASFTVWLVGRWSSRDEAATGVCARCGRPVHGCALACLHCGAAVETPLAVTWLGRTSSKPAADRAGRPFRLVAVGRCPACANRIGRNRACRACGLAPFADRDFTNSYVNFIDRRVPIAGLACWVAGLVPILGAVGGVIIYRLMLVGPLKRYTSIGHGFGARWTVRLACLGLFAFQVVPVLGAFALPTMALLNQAAYRKAFVKSNLT